MEDLAVTLTSVFLQAVGCEGLRRQSFALRDLWRLAINGRGGGKQEAFHLGVTRGDEQLQRGIQVVLIGFQRLC
jgi:hypothetical protein